MQRIGADAIAGTHVLQNELPSPAKVRYDYRKFAGGDTPIVIDNGACNLQCRGTHRLCRVIPMPHRLGQRIRAQRFAAPVALIAPRPECALSAGFLALVGKPKTRKEGDPASYVGR